MLHCRCSCWDNALQPSTSQLLPAAAAVPAPTCRLLLHPCPAAGQWNRWATTAAALPSSLPSTSPCSSSGAQLCLAFRQRACTAMGHLYSSAAVKLVLPYLTKLPLPLPVQGRVHSLLQSAVPPAGRPSSAAAGSRRKNRSATARTAMPTGTARRPPTPARPLNVSGSFLAAQT